MKKALTIIKLTIALTVALTIGFGIGYNVNNYKVDANQLTTDNQTSNNKETIGEKPMEHSPVEEVANENDTIEEVVTNEKTTSSNEEVNVEKDTITDKENLSKKEVPVYEVKTAADEKQASEEVVYELAVLFEAPIQWAIVDNDVLVDYNSIEQLITEFYADFANVDLARNFAYAFFYEENNQVLLKPGQLPNMFQMDKGFEIINVSENEFKVKQADREMEGSTIYLVYIFKFDEKMNAWKIEDIQYE